MNPLPFLPGVPDDLAQWIAARGLPIRGKHRRDPAEKRKTLARRRAANKVARASRRLNRRLQRLRA